MPTISVLMINDTLFLFSFFFFFKSRTINWSEIKIIIHYFELARCHYGKLDIAMILIYTCQNKLGFFFVR